MVGLTCEIRVPLLITKTEWNGQQQDAENLGNEVANASDNSKSIHRSVLFVSLSQS